MADQSMTYNTSANLTANSISRTGYAFTSWNTKAYGSGTAYANKASVKSLTAEDGSSVTLFAQWIPLEYTITYNLDNGTNTI